MSISGVNTSNINKLQQFLKMKNPQKSGLSSKVSAEYTKNGSIFNADKTQVNSSNKVFLIKIPQPAQQRHF